MKKELATTLALLLLGAGCATAPSAPVENRAALTLPDGKEIRVEVARTPDEQAQGLADRSSVGDGMLFCMEGTTIQRFWMLGMQVPIDMVWIHGGEVRGVAAEVPLREGMGNGDRDPTVRESPEPVNMVLELPSAWAERHQVVVGAQIEGAVEACR